VQLEGTNYLNMREVQVFDTSGVNRALNKLATQSSTTTPGDEASKAVNGNLNDNSHTNNDAGMYHEKTKSKLTVTAPFHSKRLTLSLTLVLIKAPGGRWIWERVLQCQGLLSSIEMMVMQVILQKYQAVYLIQLYHYSTTKALL
jgi:hypothetical protein